MTNAAPLLQLERITKTYETGETRNAVLAGIDFAMAGGESVAIVGPSGSGKSTLLNIIGTLDRPSSGTVRLDGKDLAALNEQSLAAVRNEKIGFVFQLHHLLPQCSVLENVLVPTLVAGRRRADVIERAKLLLERVGLAHRLTHRPGQLSGGERQRVAVVRALINGPALLLADEPTGSLDHAAAESLTDLLVALNEQENVSIVMVTHADRLAGRMGRVCELRDGRLTQTDRRTE